MDAPPSPPDSPQSLPTSPTGVFEFPMSMAPSIVEGVATWNRDTEKIPMVEMAMRLQILKDELDRVYLEIDSFRMWQEENPSTAEEVARWTEGELKANEMYELMLRSTLEERKIRCESEIAELEKKLKESRKLAEANLELPSHDNKVLKRELESTKNKLLDEEIEERDKPVAANSKPLSYDIKVLKRIEELESIIASKDKLLKTFDSILKNDPTSATMEDDGTHPTLNLLRESKKNERDLKARVKGLEDQLDDLIVTRDDSESKIKSLSAANGKYKVETAKLDVEISALRSRVQELERSNANSLSTKLRLDGRIVELQKQVGDQNVELKEIDILLATVRKELRIANKVKTDFQSQLRECQTDKLTLKAKVALSDNIRDDLAGQKRYNAELKKRIVEFGDQIDQAMEERLDGLATYDGEVRRMQSFDLGYRDGLWGFEGGNVLKNSLSNTSGRLNQSNGEQIVGALTLDSDLGRDSVDSLVGTPASIRSTTSSTYERGATIASRPSMIEGGGSMQGNSWKQSQPTSALSQTEGHVKRRTDHQYPLNSIDSGPYTSARPSAAGAPNSMRKTSSIIHKDDSGVTPRPWSGRGRGSLHEGPFTKGQPMSTQAYTESYTAEQTESRIAGRIESHSVGPQTGRTENHSAGIQTERTGSHNAGIQTESSGFPASPNPFPVTVVAISNSPDAKSPPKSHNAETQTICSYFTEPPESRNSPRSPGWTGTTKSRDTQMTEKTLSTSPIHSDTRSIEKIRAETLHAIIQRVIYYSETTVDRPVLIEGQQSLLPNKHSTSFRLYRYGSPLLLLLALTVLVLMMLDISNEKEKWLAANETTRQMAWVMRAGGSYGFPFLSWLFNDAFLEVDAYSYG